MDRMETMQQCEYLLQIQIKDERVRYLIILAEILLE
jgi:hypothetical protein